MYRTLLNSMAQEVNGGGGKMILQKTDQIVELEIWNPRWHKERGKKHVLLACYKVDNAKTDHLKIKFTKSEAMKGDWYISRKKARRHKKESNGTIMCYAVPLDTLEPLEINEKDWRLLI